MLSYLVDIVPPETILSQAFNVITYTYMTDIEITPWKMRAYDFYSRVEQYQKTNE